MGTGTDVLTWDRRERIRRQTRDFETSSPSDETTQTYVRPGRTEFHRERFQGTPACQKHDLTRTEGPTRGRWGTETVTVLDKYTDRGGSLVRKGTNRTTGLGTVPLVQSQVRVIYDRPGASLKSGLRGVPERISNKRLTVSPTVVPVYRPVTHRPPSKSCVLSVSILFRGSSSLRRHSHETRLSSSVSRGPQKSTPQSGQNGVGLSDLGSVLTRVPPKITRSDSWSPHLVLRTLTQWSWLKSLWDPRLSETREGEDTATESKCVGIDE